MTRWTIVLAFLAILAVGPLETRSAAEAQPSARIPRIGILAVSSPAYAAPLLEAFRRELRTLGHGDVVIEARWAEGRLERLPELAADLVRLKVDVIVSAGTAGPLAAKQATATIPIVMVGAGDPVASGLVASLARPGGNVTGVSVTAPELGGKRLQLLKEAVPGLSRVAVLWNPTDPDAGFVVSGTEVAAKKLGIQVQSFELRRPEDFDGAFAGITTGRAEALMAVHDPLIFIHAARIVDFATRTRRAAIYGASEYVQGGGLMSYGPRSADGFRRAVTYVDRILRGAKPADLPVTEPRQYELIVNAQAAKAIGLTVPQSLLLQAERVIE